ncbi:chromosome segregation protein SMC [Mycoplasma putrefaciens]|uniref:Chromosome partition protein Smc n=2 Tax=Mycoplasma putrefaciens TaxID=2123 RepID=M9WAB8_9MOLU|nr:chromosome segregation protein SMC [Mycoplasma putrefaciens]AEM68611.1 chromosome segregation protein SMC [Mycoplasma putrefaciens KS1]AGJ90928.1 Chromosome segregation ATPase [Mycoplasma putrefaciens Mput9231]
MLFLKQIRASGFKSFAELTVMDFNYEMIGVVGPNGSGKSNITDAIRWALGEQSTKSLRGSKMDDIVFSGSADKPAAKIAEVTLVFDNSQKSFSSVESDLVEITRKFDKSTRESEFFINGQKSKLRDIQDIALETGLTRSSIAIISQGTIANFAEAKPEYKRDVFDDAAGIAKYKKRKRETLLKLEKAAENLNRLEDLANEIARRLPNLERQANKAKKYKDKIAQLQDIELYILTKDLRVYINRIEELREQKLDLDVQIKRLTNEINMSQEEINLIFEENSSADRDLEQLNNQFNQIVQKISNLKVRKKDAELKEEQNASNYDQDQYKAKIIKKEFDQSYLLLESEKQKVNEAEDLINELKEKYDWYTQKYNEIYKEIETIRTNLSKLNIQIETLEYNKRNAFSSFNDGVSAIINNAKQIGGVVGVLKSLITVDPEYQIAISVTSAGHMNSIVFKTDQDVKRAIDFLKKNNLNRVTFLPLNTLSANVISYAQKQIIEQSVGFVGFANELVNNPGEIQIAVDYALSTIVVVDTYENAVSLAKSIGFRYNIVSLDGQRILPHGAIIGGSTKGANIFEKQDDRSANSLEELKARLQALEDKETEKTKQLTEYKNNNDTLREQITDVNANIRNTKTNIQNLNNKLKDLSEEHRTLVGIDLLTGSAKNSSELESIRLAKEIIELEKERDQIQLKINTISSNKTKTSQKQKEINKENNKKRQELDSLKQAAADAKTEYSLLLEKRTKIGERLMNGYKISVETALEMQLPEIDDEQAARLKIEELISEISEIGNVNLDSIEEYEQEKSRFDYYDAQINDVRNAKQTLENIILDIDIAMETQFRQVINDVNQALPEVFARLFGGGTAELIFTDPDNILETGVDIKVYPPGKKITNLNLLSGGEKSLVALSVLFSILKARPLPLVILDEAEAPLDPANVERFARYVKRFSNKTQFIVVTHRDGTMENCEALFGVTMQTKGITKIVKIKLIEAKKLI